MLVAHSEYDQQLVAGYEVAGDSLDTFLFDFQDAPEGAQQEVLEIKAACTFMSPCTVLVAVLWAAQHRIARRCGKR